MRKKFIMINIFFLVFFALASGYSFASNNEDSEGSEIMSSLAGFQPPEWNKRDMALSFDYFEAVVKNDSSVCKSRHCEREAEIIKTHICIAEECSKSDNPRPGDCLPGEAWIEKVASSLCALIENPDPSRRSAFVKLASPHDPYMNEDRVVLFLLNVLAVKVSGDACINYIKEYVGPYGSPSWDFMWYKFIGGCRILSKEESRSSIEKDFHIWANSGYCPDIKDSELSEACVLSEGKFPEDYARYFDL